jgi:hypothetical protein
MEHVKQTTPRMNPDIANGLAVKMMPKALEHLDAVTRSVAKDFIPGLRYIGFELCTPEEELRKVNPKKNDKYVIETAKSSLYLTKLKLAYTDPKAVDVRTGKLANVEEELDPCYIYVPYVGPAGRMYLSGAQYFLSPILADVVLSFEKDCIFLNLLRAKFGIRDIRHIVLKNGIHEEHKILWSNIYHVDDSEIIDKIETRPESTLVNYLFCYKGLYNTFKDYAGCTPIIGTKDINEDNYPQSDYVIYESAKQKLKGSKYQIFTPYKVAIKKSELNTSVEGFVAALFYLLDHFPDEFRQIEWLNDSRKWRLILGRIIFGKSRNAGTILEAIDDHFKSLDQYLDTIVKYKLESINIFVDNIYDFFAHAVHNYKEWSFKSKENLNSIYEKELSVLHYTLSEIVNSINTFYFKLKSTYKTSDKRPLTKEDINKIVRSVIKPKRIFAIKDSPSGLSNMAYPGDNMFMKITSNVIPQKSLSKTGNDEIDIGDPVNFLHESFMAIGSHLNLPKSSPIGYRTLSPYTMLDKDNKFIIDPEEKKYLDNVHEIIRRK